ncbi:hypothetical protein M011DRAFT_448543 [Sporormia fimetaria CBS 119925]|uniref:Smr domain-containing protein n=1 Tax=Sporormia fimetaria CBS 119925 TaxID=1340428 RepID=A0A6A6V3Z7_9PLEO|nr:hypothetical protein M011DRAFT_448543 [Sporormia fimetaria CBS 119925]
MDEDLELLLQEYCPPLDDTIVHLIYDDYKGSPDSVPKAREVLDTLKHNAIVEQATGFDPSGSSGDVEQSPFNPSDSLSRNNSSERDATSSSSEWVSQTTEDSSESATYFKDSEQLNTGEKEEEITNMFPTLSRESVLRVLRRCNNDINRATDELLNQAWFAGEGNGEVTLPKGIDAFASEHHIPQRKKGAKKKNKKANKASTQLAEEPEPQASVPTKNAWTNRARDVETIAACTDIPASKISSLYHQNGSSTPATIRSLIEADLASNKTKDPPAPIIQAALDLNTSFPTLPLDHAVSLIRLTPPPTSNAHTLATLLTTSPQAIPNSSISIITPTYAPVRLDDSSSPTRQTSLPPLAPPPHAHTAASLASARATAFSQASSSYRLGKSSPYMKAAAGYYAQLGRDLSSHLHAASAAEADALVASQSTGSMLDLHGVSVDDAKRIASREVKRWWEGLGEERIPGYRGGQGEVGGGGFRVITGVGRHSEGRRGKLGPAVTRVLMKEGWRVEVGEGAVVVLGKRKG